VEGFLRRAKVSSPTLDLCAAFEKHRQDIARALKSFPCLPGQTGAMSAVGPHLYIDLFSDPELLERRLDGVLTSALLEGFAGFSDVRVPLDVARRGLTDLLNGVQHGRSLRPRFSSREDRDLLAWGREGTASVFVSGGAWRHLAAHLKPGRLTAGGREHAQDLEEARRGYLQENRDWFEAMRDAYAPRRKPYFEAVAELPAQAARRRTEARLLRAAAGPFPGHLIGVEEADPEPVQAPPVQAGGLMSTLAGRASRVSGEFSGDLYRAGALLDRLRT